MLASAAVFTGIATLLSPSDRDLAESARPAPDAVEAEENSVDVVTDDPGRGRVPTFFDGQGGVAGVQLTEKQRKAVVGEALRRGMSKDQAYDLAYGDAASAPDDRSDLRPMSEGGRRTADAKQPQTGELMYRAVAPSERVAAKHQSAERQEDPVGRPDAPRRDDGSEIRKAKDVDTRQKITESMDKLLPDPLEEALGGLLPFRMWMAQICEPGAEPSWTVEHDVDKGTVTVTAESQMTAQSKVTAEVTLPVPAGGDAEPDAAPVVTVTVTDPVTDEVLVVSSPQVAETAQDVSRVAIGEVVEAVLDAREAGHSAVAEDLPAVEAVESAK
ncbi:hypothetical protein [Streptomyces sp. NPDC057552]|uniref:hypothetical protein n=1 Tax=Streptomyces sp. NPDC057552 TaxID=3350537 RepID=UPI0036764DE0